MSTTLGEEGWFYIDEEAPEDECGFATDYPNNTFSPYENVRCERPVWNDTGRCVWHAEVDEKPLDALQAARTDNPERLEGAYLAAVEIGGAISFEDCVLFGAAINDAYVCETDFTNADLRRADLSYADLRWADLSDADFTAAHFQNADLTYANLFNTDLTDANLSEAKFIDANLSNVRLTGANLTDADLAGAILTDAHLPSAKLTNAFLVGARLTDSYLNGADLADANLFGADLTNANLSDTCLTDANLRGNDLTDAKLLEANLTNANLIRTTLTDANLIKADLTGTYLTDADLTDADLRGVDLTDAYLDLTTLTKANLERAQMTRTDFFGADLTGTRLYGAVFDNPQVNSRTEFGDHYADALRDEDTLEGDGDSDETDDPEVDKPESDSDPGKTPPRLKAIWTNRQVEQIAQQNALPDIARQAYIERKNLRRDQYLEEGRPLKYAWALLAGTFTGYAENPWRVVYTSFGVIGVWSVLYFLLGFIQLPDGSTRGEPIGLGLLPTYPLPDLVADALVSVYFSLVTFTNLGYGDLQPTGWAQGLATIESFVGALLMALLVFVLGRRTTW